MVRRLLAVQLAFLFARACLAEFVVDGCPFVCQCFSNLGEDSGTLTVDCRGQDLFEIPAPLPVTTSHLDVSSNEIQFIRTADLLGLPRLTFLQLQNNAIMMIQPGAFANVPHLERLNLFNNQISTLRADTFLGLSRLQSLVAYNMQLQEIEEGVFDPLLHIVEIDLSSNSLEVVRSLMFSGLPRLQRLFLGDNSIVNVEQMAIHNLSSLVFLRLEDNQLETVTTRAFTQVPRVRTVHLEGNPLECGCDALWLYNFLRRRGIQGPTCEAPENLAGRNLVSLTEDEFCDLPTASIVAPDDIILANGMTLLLSCDTTGAPPPEVVWSRDGMTFDLEDERVEIMGATLMIINVTREDSGMYYCAATSTAGTVSTSVRVTVLNVTMENGTMVTSQLGRIVVLECSSDIPPGVPVRWEFNATTLQLSGKYAITSTGSLVVTDLQLGDMGLYVCVVDSLRLTRELVLQASPIITEFPEGPCTHPGLLVVNTSTTLNVTCAAFGIPPPSVRWLVDGVLQREQGPGEDMNGGTTVVNLVQSVPPEEGNYTCVAENELGQTQRTLIVEVDVILQINFTSPFINIMVFAGDAAVLECDPSTLGLDPSDIVLVRPWVRMGGVQLPEGRVNITRANTLIIFDVIFSDTDLYQCEVETTTGTARLVYLLTVFEPPSIAKECPVPVRVVEAGSAVVLNCATLGSPVPDITWSRDGVTLVTDGRVTLMRDGGLQLMILMVEDGDSGEYVCNASNEFGNDSYTIQLDVQRRLDFAFVPEATGATVGEVVQLRCSGRGNPAPVVTWWREINSSFAEQVQPHDRIIISDEFLVILSAQESDEGFYYCNLTSPLQQRVSDDIFLSIFVPPTLPPLQNEFRVFEGTRNVTLPCSGTGDPPPVVQWLRDDVVLPLPGIHLQEPGGSLVILEAGAGDDGVYVCRVANVAGEVLHEVRLIVRVLPSTMVEPRMVRANVGCEVIFFCSDGGNVPNEFGWSFNGQPLTSGGNVLVRPTGELVLSDLQVEDSGNYTCTIWGLAGMAEDFAILTVEDPLFSSGVATSPPTISTPTPLQQRIPAGQTAQFVCVAMGFPPPTIVWLRNGEPVPNLRRITIENGLLTIEQVRVTDEASYECVASNVFGMNQTQFILNITVPPMLIVRPAPLQLTAGQVICLSCVANGDPPPTIVWLFNDTMIIPSNRVIINSTVLSVFNTTTNDGGIYSCIAINEAGMTEYAIPVTVLPFQIEPNITVPPQSSTVMAGNSVVLDCIAEGIPQPQITWFKDGERLQTTCVNLNQTECVLVDGPSVFIQSAREEDSGRFTCVAENTAGRSVYEVFVTVTTAEMLPLFTVYPLPVWAPIGSNFSIDCQADGSPISWLFGFELLNDTENVFVLDNGTLVFVDAQEEDAGLYTCRATNIAGINQIIISVDVGNITNATSPTLVQFPVAPLELDPGESIVLNCVADGNPPPTVVWLLEGMEFNFTDNVFVAPNGSLFLVNVTELEAGNYTCFAHNGFGTAEAHITVHIRDNAIITGQGLPEFTVMPHDMEALAGSAVHINCQARGSPTPYLLWMTGDPERPVYESKTLTVALNNSLVIAESHPNHTGRYTCRAVNAFGMVAMAIKLRVMPRMEPPYFLVLPEDVRVVVGGHFILRCAARTAAGVVHTRWTAPGKTQLQGRMELLADGSLLVTRTQLQDSGTYTCVASNQYGQPNATAFVRILRQPVNATWSVKVGTATRLRCGEGCGEGSGEGSGEGVEWRKDGQPLQPSSSIFVLGVVLVVTDVQERHEGEYTCTFSGLSVNVFLEVIVPPTITSAFNYIGLHSGETAALHCLATGRPRPLVSWFHSNMELHRDNRHSVLHNGTLLVYSITPQDSGDYCCIANNRAGEDEIHVLLIIV